MNAIFFTRSCQCAALALFSAVFLAVSALAASALDVPSAPVSSQESTLAEVFNDEALAHPHMDSFFKRLSQMSLEGSGSFNWRNVGPEYPQYEAQIQNEVYLADMYFGLGGPVADGVPFLFEMGMPTSSQGEARFNQFYFEYDRIDNTRFQLGKFLVPFGRYNELYRPDDFLTVTRPLLFSSPDSLDLVVRLNSPRPPLTVGYTDIGARASYYPTSDNPLIPDEITFFVVNGLGEESNRLRTYPNTDNLGVPPIPGNGTEIDFGHQDNNLADNNNSKAPGARLVYSLGNVRLPWPIPEKISDLNGVNLGLSAMGSQYDLEQNLNYQIYDADLTFDYKGIKFASEYVYEVNQFIAPSETYLINNCANGNNTSSCTNVPLLRDFEINQGYYVQASFPVMRKPPVGQRLTGILVINQMWRRGPAEDLFLNQYSDGVQYASLDAINPSGTRATTQMDKYTAALNWQLSDHFWIKLEFSYWLLGRAADGSVFGNAGSETNSVLATLPNDLGRINVYQSALSFVVGF